MKPKKKIKDVFKDNRATPRRDPALRKAMKAIQDKKLMRGTSGGASVKAAKDYLAVKLLMRAEADEVIRTRLSRLMVESEYVKEMLSNPPADMDEAEAANYLKLISERLETLLNSPLMRANLEVI